MHFPSLTCSIRKPLLPCCKLQGLVTLPNPSGECQMVPWMSQAMGLGSQRGAGKGSQHRTVSVNPKPIFFAPISTCDLPKLLRAQHLFLSPSGQSGFSTSVLGKRSLYFGSTWDSSPRRSQHSLHEGQEPQALCQSAWLTSPHIQPG